MLVPVIKPVSPVSELQDPELIKVIARLHSWFGTDFTIFDGDSGYLLRTAHGVPLEDLERFGPLVRVLADGGPARCLAAEGALGVWGLRFEIGARTYVALGCMLTDLAPVRVRDVVDVMQCDEGRAERWIAHRAIWPYQGLESFMHVAVQNLASTHRETELRQENECLSSRLTNCGNELSLLNDLSTRLRLDVHPEPLIHSVLKSLQTCIPSVTLAAVWNHRQRQHVCLTGKRLPREEIIEAAERFQRTDSMEPAVINLVGDHAHWQSRAIAVAIPDNDARVGMLLALGRIHEGEFGRFEASVLHSVAGVLGGFLANHRLYTEARELFEEAVLAMVSAIDAKDPYTCGHSLRVARVARRLAQAMELPEEEIDTIYLAGLLHDVGKIGVDDRILRKAGRLTDAEFENIKQHPDLGARILANVQRFAPVLPGVRHHHEAWDGSGYPDGLVGQAIPREAMIIAVADALDAMTSDRPYRQGMSIERVEAILANGRDSQWAPEVVDAYYACRAEVLAILQEPSAAAAARPRKTSGPRTPLEL